MPVSVFPFIVAFIALGTVAIGITRRRWRSKVTWWVSGVVVFVAPATAEAWRGYGLHGMAEDGDPLAMFRYSQWLESAPDRFANLCFVAPSRNFSESWKWLLRAKESGLPEAEFAMGVRLKYEQFVPVVVPDCDGQLLIDSAIANGYEPPVPEHEYYWRRFRNPHF